VNEKTNPFVVPHISITIVIIDSHMVVIQVQIGRNMIDDLLLDGGSGLNIITKQLKAKLGLPKPKPTPYDLRMVDQTKTKLVGLIKDLKMYIHGIPYIVTFTILQNIVVDSNYILCCLIDHGLEMQK